MFEKMPLTEVSKCNLYPKYQDLLNAEYPLSGAVSKFSLQILDDFSLAI
jgi:hypothetical protein